MKSFALVAMMRGAVTQPLAGFTYDLTPEDDLLPPDRWAELRNVSCGGRRQSPILLSALWTVPCEPAKPVIFSRDTGFCEIEAELNPAGWGEWAFECENEPFVEFQGEKFIFAQMHIHSGAEHSVAGGFADAELHLVHRLEGEEPGSPTDSVIVIAVQLVVQPANDENNVLIEPLFRELADITPDLPRELINAGDNDAGANVTITSPYELVPPSAVYWYYEGSLTTPPCSEIVQWLVVQEPVRISQPQLDLFRAGMEAVPGSLVSDDGDNNRPLQPLNDREIQICSFFDKPRQQ